ncbi:MAG: 2-amino-4-hydroxy-6-hydroxymethyldihydropteridine diphosphokinase [Pseudomonadota bacterium]
MKLIGFGANLSSKYGTPEQTIQKALESLEAHEVRVVRQSSLWLSAPVPISDQPWYHNGVAIIETSHDPSKLLKLLKNIEKDFGRMSLKRNASRVLDLDILVFDDVVMSEERLTIPHPRMHERAFVLYPLQELLPDWSHSTLDRSVAQMIEMIPEGQDIKKMESKVA